MTPAGVTEALLLAVVGGEAVLDYIVASAQWWQVMTSITGISP